MRRRSYNYCDEERHRLIYNSPRRRADGDLGDRDALRGYDIVQA